MAEEPAASSLKRSRDDAPDVDQRPDDAGAVDDASSDEDGPMPAPAPADGAAPVKRRKVLKHERLYLDRLPASDRYYRSFMHRDTLVSVHVTPTNFVLTSSVDGILKFWKKRDPTDGEPGIEFVKLYRAHLSPILATAVSADGLIAATIAADASGSQQGSIKVFDVEGFDMINMITLPYTPRTCCWIHVRGQALALLAVAEAGSSVIRIYDGRGDGTPLGTVDKVHRSPVELIAYNEAHDTVVSSDEGGMIEYWSSQEPYEHPASHGLWKYKSETDLYEFKKSKSRPASIAFSPAGTHFVTTSLTSDRQVRVFSFLSGKLYRKYDESLAAIQDMQQAGTASHRLDDMEFGRRLAQEREIERQPDVAGRERAVFDESGAFVLYPTLLGIKVVNVVTNKVAHVLGKDETARFLNISLFQGTTLKQAVTTVAMAASDNPLLQARQREDPTLFCTAHKRSRFYLFTRETESTAVERDIFNEKPTREEASMAAATKASLKLPRNATLHTSLGDVHLRLFPEQVPKTVENFVGLAKKGYYDRVLFHRVIPKFMIQTGDPSGNGTGGESLWGGTFEDEFVPELKHDRAFTLSMANAGPRTNDASRLPVDRS